VKIDFLFRFYSGSYKTANYCLEFDKVYELFFTSCQEETAIKCSSEDHIAIAKLVFFSSVFIVEIND